MTFVDPTTNSPAERTTLPASPEALPPTTASPAPARDPETQVGTDVDSPPPAAQVPPPPTAVKMTSVETDLIEEGYYANLTTTVTWNEAVTAGTEIRVYGVNACFAPPTGGTCLVEHTALPASVRDLIATAPASKGKVSWTWPAWDDIGGAVMAHGDKTYEAVVIAAYNAAGHSKFIIIASAEWCPDCTY